jgi:AcrR family transcriptional regulator
MCSVRRNANIDAADAAAGTGSPAAPTAGDRVRSALLEAAGAVFAEKGYSQATSKEICERAGMNSAAVNYHFGSFERLYAATLALAHRQLVALEQLREIASSDLNPRQKLRAYIALIIGRLARPRTSWEMRLLSREMLSPSQAREAFVKAEILPKMLVMRGIIADVLGVPMADPRVGRSLLLVMSPGLMLAIADRSILTHIIPGLTRATEIEPLIDHCEQFIYAGLRSVAKRPGRSPAVMKARRRIHDA